MPGQKSKLKIYKSKFLIQNTSWTDRKLSIDNVLNCHNATCEDNIHSIHDGGKEKSNVVHHFLPQVNVQIIHEGTKITSNEENVKYYKCPVCKEEILKAFLKAHLRNNHVQEVLKCKENKS